MVALNTKLKKMTNGSERQNETMALNTKTKLITRNVKLGRGDSECCKPRMYGGIECQDCREMMKGGIRPSVTHRYNPQSAGRV